VEWSQESEGSECLLLMMVLSLWSRRFWTIEAVIVYMEREADTSVWQALDDACIDRWGR